MHNFIDAETGIKRMRDEFYAFHVEDGTGFRIINEIFDENEKCGLQIVDYWNKINPWITIQKNSSYKKLIKIGYV